jgi:hypothetical protein
VVGKIQALDAQAQVFGNAQAAAVEQLVDQLGGALHFTDDRQGFLVGEDGRKMLGRPRRRISEDIRIFVQKEDRAERLVLLAPNARTMCVEAATRRSLAG